MYTADSLYLHAPNPIHVMFPFVLFYLLDMKLFYLGSKLNISLILLYSFIQYEQCYRQSSIRLVVDVSSRNFTNNFSTFQNLTTAHHQIQKELRPYSIEIK